METNQVEKGIDLKSTRALGAILGACVGDAVGAVLEGRNGVPSQMDVAVIDQPIQFVTYC